MTTKRVFISYAPADREWVESFAHSLRDQGVTVALDEGSTRRSGRALRQLESALRQSDLVAFVVTPEIARLPAILFEVGAAVGLGKQMVPIVAKGAASKLPYPLRSRRYRLRESPEETARKLVEDAVA